MDNETVWKRARDGRHSAVLGELRGDPPEGVRVLRVHCDMSRQTLGPILEVSREALALLDEQDGLAGDAPSEQGLRHRLLGEAPGRHQGGTVVEALNRLQQRSDRPCVVIFEQVEAADMATSLMLREIVTHPGWLKAALVLVFAGDGEPEGLPAKLLDAIRRAGGDEAVVRLERAEGAPVDVGHVDERGLPERLSPEALRVLRAGALIGAGFEAELIGRLLGLTELEVLELLQQALDLGVPIRDQGASRFALPEEVAAALRGSMLPSLANAWHRRLAALLSPPPGSAPAAPAAEPEDAPFPDLGDVLTDPSDTSAEPDEAGAVEATEAVEAEPDAIEAEAPPEAGEPEAPSSEAFEESPPNPWTAPEPEEPTPDAPEPAPAANEEEVHNPMAAAEAFAREMAEALAEESGQREEEAQEAPQPAPEEDGDARAAPHFQAVGEYDAAAQRYLAAAGKAAALGAYSQALHFTREALGLLQRLPPSEPRRLLRVQLLAEMGALQCEAIGGHGDSAFSLSESLQTLERAQQLLTPEDPAPLQAMVSQRIAQTCYELGDQASLKRALDELTRASTLLRESGDPTSAVRLLNDQAAVWVRLGDPVRANRLLEHSRDFYQEQDPDNPVTRAELAETEHMLARLILHVSPRPGREQDAVEVGLTHAHSAEAHYKALRARREVARVWETIGRLLLRGGDIEQALHQLAAALEVQRDLGDLLGLARTTAALSEALVERRQIQHALALLEQSIALNFEKGSPLGLAHNREALDRIARAIAPLNHLRLRQAEQRLRDRLTQAESVLGQVELPPRI